MYSRMDQVKFREDSFYKILLCSFLNILSHLYTQKVVSRAVKSCMNMSMQQAIIPKTKFLVNEIYIYNSVL